MFFWPTPIPLFIPLPTPLPLCLTLVVIAGITVPLAVADIRSLRLPNSLVLVGYVAFGISAELVSLNDSSSIQPSPALVCAITLAGAAGLRFCGVLGMGDVKLMGLLAGALQLLPTSTSLPVSNSLPMSNSPPAMLVAAGATVVLVAPAALVAVLHGRRALALGPFLLAGFWVAVLWAALV